MASSNTISEGLHLQRMDSSNYTAAQAGVQSLGHSRSNLMQLIRGDERSSSISSNLTRIVDKSRKEGLESVKNNNTSATTNLHGGTSLAKGADPVIHDVVSSIPVAEVPEGIAPEESTVPEKSEEFKKSEVSKEAVEHVEAVDSIGVQDATSSRPPIYAGILPPCPPGSENHATVAVERFEIDTADVALRSDGHQMRNNSATGGSDKGTLASDRPSSPTTTTPSPLPLSSKDHSSQSRERLISNSVPPMGKIRQQLYKEGQVSLPQFSHSLTEKEDAAQKVRNPASSITSPTPLSSIHPSTILSASEPQTSIVNPPGRTHSPFRDSFSLDLKQINGQRRPMYTPAVLRSTTILTDVDVSRPDGLDRYSDRPRLVSSSSASSVGSMSSLSSYWNYLRGSNEGLARPAKERDWGPSTAHWKPNSSTFSCFHCGKMFNYLTPSRRRHHCRSCGEIFCGDCLKNYIYLDKDAKFAIFGPEAQEPSDGSKKYLSKVCLSCAKKYEQFVKDHTTRDHNFGHEGAAEGYEKNKSIGRRGTLTGNASIVPADWDWSSF
ncbi:DEKNAAC101269 [Brettanomyces naardenensis]|uniref:DEKNAAC101269 n=1 Tax=Brettanomyces naardenensis TaxID=13370 RepID=A0A448YHV1_BRENA|nr:DEKNAAC101269 [Brettanomyces naardenensis]